MVVGVTPFDGDNAFAVMHARVTGDPIAPRKKNPNVSPQAEEIILHAMERDPRKRYQTAEEMKAELDNPNDVQLTGRCDRLRSPSPWKRGWKKILLISVGIAIPVIILILLILLIIHRGPAH